MDCREAQVILSAMADRTSVGSEELAHVKAHCRRCMECAAFATAIAQIRRVKAPQAPRGLAKRIATIVAEQMAAERPTQEETVEEADTAVAAMAAPAAAAAVTEPEPAAAAADEPEAGGFSIPWLSRERLWTVIAAVGTSAAVVLLAIAVSGQLSGRAGIDREAQEAITRSLSGPTAGVATVDQAPASGSAATAERSQAPPFIAFNGRVYAPSTAAEEVNASHLTTVGTIYSALGGNDAPASLDVYTRPGDTSIVIRKPDGTYQVCAPVVRSLGDAVYQLTTGADLARYGVWPRLPADIPEPTVASGAPVFIGAGNDDLGVKIYARIGLDTTSGIAVGPGARSSDPSGGNPNWTWWVRVQ